MKYGSATYRPLATKNTQPRLVRHDLVILHTMVGYLTSTDVMFHENGYGGTESHFGVGGKWGGDVAKGYDGRVFQWVDTAYRADANLEGNHRSISIETADNAPKSAKDIEPWTARQLDAIAGIVAWACEEYDIPPVLVPDSKMGRRGIAYHRQGCDPWRVSGGEAWSKSRGKECPGDKRIAQIETEIIPRVKALLSGKKPPLPAVSKENEVPLTDKIKLGPSAAKALDLTTKDTITTEYALLWGGARGAQLAGAAKAHTGQLNAIVAQLGAMNATVATLANALAQAGSITAEQVQAAAEAGAQAALEQLGRVLQDDDDPTVAGPPN